MPSDEPTIRHVNPTLGSSLVASCLTKHGPRRIVIIPRITQATTGSYQLKLNLIKLFNSRYPEENFGRDQRLDGSMSISPLYPSMTNDLHVSIAKKTLSHFSGTFTNVLGNLNQQPLYDLMSEQLSTLT